MWHICSRARTVELENSFEKHLFLGSGRGTSSGTSAARQQVLNEQQLNSDKNGAFSVIHAEML
jgi:hypothetical protein